MICSCGTQAEERWMVKTSFWWCSNCRDEARSSVEGSGLSWEVGTEITLDHIYEAEKRLKDGDSSKMDLLRTIDTAPATGKAFPAPEPDIKVGTKFTYKYSWMDNESICTITNIDKLGDITFHYLDESGFAKCDYWDLASFKRAMKQGKTKILP